MLPTARKQLLQLKALADPIRLRLAMLCSAVECSVSELTQVSGLSQPRVSQHLKQLCDSGILERFRDGHFVFYRVADDAHAVQKILSLFPEDEPQFGKDFNKLRKLRVDDDSVSLPVSEADRLLHRMLVELTVAQPLGELIDIGCGQGRLLKLLASRAHRIVGVDIDSDARRLARAELLLGGTANCTLRQGDMYDLPFKDGEFDTVIVDDVLSDAKDPAGVINEAARILAPSGRLVFITSVDADSAAVASAKLAALAASTHLRLAQPRQVPNKNPSWLLAVASVAAQVAA